MNGPVPDSSPFPLYFIWHTSNLAFIIQALPWTLGPSSPKTMTFPLSFAFLMRSCSFGPKEFCIISLVSNSDYFISSVCVPFQLVHHLQKQQCRKLGIQEAGSLPLIGSSVSQEHISPELVKCWDGGRVEKFLWDWLFASGRMNLEIMDNSV